MTLYEGLQEVYKKYGYYKEGQISIILVCHDPRFFDYADKCYLVNDGNVRLVSKDDKIVLEEETSEE